MGLFDWKSSVDKALDVVGDTASKGMDMWDNSDFTAQEKSGLFIKLLAATKSQGTSIRRGILLKFVIAVSGSTLLLALVYNHFGMTTQYDGVVAAAETWKVGWSFVGAVSFYFLTQFSGAGKS